MAHKATKKRPAYVQEIIDSVNERLKFDKEKDNFCPLMVWICNYLLKKDMYRGYNMFNEVIRDGVSYNVYAGSATNFEYLQIL